MNVEGIEGDGLDPYLVRRSNITDIQLFQHSKLSLTTETFFKLDFDPREMTAPHAISEKPVIVDHIDYDNTPSIDFDLGSLNSFNLALSPKARKIKFVCSPSSTNYHTHTVHQYHFCLQQPHIVSLRGTYPRPMPNRPRSSPQIVAKRFFEISIAKLPPKWIVILSTTTRRMSLVPPISM